MKNLIIILFSILWVSVIKAQNKNTNIDTTSIQLNWMTEDLKTIYFQNGEELKIARSLSEWNEFNLKNRSSVYIYEPEPNKSVYLYNWYALKDPRGLAPKGFHIPSVEEFKSAKVSFSSTLINSAGITNFNTTSAPYIMDEGFFDEYFLHNYWTKVDGFNDISEWPAIELNKNDQTMLELPFNKKSGLSVRCLENLQDKLKDNTLSYKQILPVAYKELTNQLIEELKKGSDFKNGRYQIAGKIQFSSAGINTSPSFKLMNQSHSIPTSFFQLEKIVKNYKVYPFYNSIPISSQSEINLVIDVVESKNKKDLSLNSRLFSEINGMSIAGLIPISQNKTTNIQLNAESTIVKLDQRTLMSVKAVNPSISLLAIIGQGTNSINRYYDINSQYQNKFVYKYSKFAKRAVPTFLAIAFLSKGISAAFYSSYRKEISNESVDFKYKVANVSQKTFVVSSGIYSILALTDFSVALTIGIQNKKRSNQINRIIKTNYPGGFIIK